MSDPDAFTTCEKCDHVIPSSNMQLHSLRCAGSSPEALRSTEMDRRANSDAMTSFSTSTTLDSRSLRPTVTWAAPPTSYEGQMISTSPTRSCTNTRQDRSMFETYPPPDPEQQIGTRIHSNPERPSGWPCPACTFDNAAQTTQCEMCETVRMHPAQHSSTESPNRAPLVASSPLPPGWDCPRYVQPLNIDK